MPSQTGRTAARQWHRLHRLHQVQPNTSTHPPNQPTCVHRPCRLYMPLPSACRLITRRLGQASAAPTAMGMPAPMAPPGQGPWVGGWVRMWMLHSCQ